MDMLTLIKSFGYLGLFTAVFLENGVVPFFFLPGDTLLFSVGFLASQGYLNLYIIMAGCFVFSVAAYSFGYHTGKTTGKILLKNGDRKYLKQEHLDKANAFYKKYGSVTLIVARFMPIRSVVCFLAGAAEMDYRTFTFYNILGGLIWAISMPLLGFYFGKIFPPEYIKMYLLPVILAAVAFSFVPGLFHIWRERRLARQELLHQKAEDTRPEQGP
jgi:membrane-associated protein